VLSYNELIFHYNDVCAKCNAAIQKANDAIAAKGCLEIDLVTTREELKKAYQELAELKAKRP
jgi:hypothetical protein